ncbi:hypothetical protein SNE25_15755 [Mucilaginibacter sabulilitoris]|uniref:Uncharacterized protein n=1 Tax=Mucilaginibacter sabulilitoris TaxID=1173583 RepID=A0ABZ0TV50_9SPHI|nr:hypothetical protein [Mucilaginibacter sabulilitoris]WPU96976.1 hypothetical protein SNE25_15755 [Mucilaginibacter sabulilitoris]
MKDATGLKISMLFDHEQYPMIGPFLKCVPGTKEIYSEPGLVACKWQNILLEAHGPGAHPHNFIFKNNEVVIRFEEDDLSAAIVTTKKAGFKAISNVIVENDYYSFAYIKFGEMIIGPYHYDTD